MLGKQHSEKYCLEANTGQEISLPPSGGLETPGSVSVFDVEDRGIRHSRGEDIPESGSSRRPDPDDSVVVFWIPRPFQVNGNFPDLFPIVQNAADFLDDLH